MLQRLQDTRISRVTHAFSRIFRVTRRMVFFHTPVDQQPTNGHILASGGPTESYNHLKSAEFRQGFGEKLAIQIINGKITQKIDFTFGQVPSHWLQRYILAHECREWANSHTCRNL